MVTEMVQLVRDETVGTKASWVSYGRLTMLVGEAEAKAIHDNKEVVLVRLYVCNSTTVIEHDTRYHSIRCHIRCT